MPLYSVRSQRVHVAEAGETRLGPPIVLVHGAGASSAVWLELVGRLARHHRVVALDVPGHGRSEGTVESVEEWRDAIATTAATMCLPPSILVGHSLGGAAALIAALA